MASQPLKKSEPESEVRITPEIEKYIHDVPTGDPTYGMPATKPQTAERRKAVFEALVQKTNSLRSAQASATSSKPSP
jgi:hypothetical protein